MNKRRIEAMTTTQRKPKRWELYKKEFQIPELSGWGVSVENQPCRKADPAHDVRPERMYFGPEDETRCDWDCPSVGRYNGESALHDAEIGPSQHSKAEHPRKEDGRYQPDSEGGSR